MDCRYHSSDHHSGAEEGNTRRAKATIVDVARKALLDLNTSIKETKSWETQRSIFTSKICNQNEKIRHLQKNNDSLTSDINNLKSYLADAVESNTRIKFEDEKIDALVVESAGKIIRTIDDLSSELLSVHDAMNVFRDRNQHLQIKTDKLRAMIRVSTGSCKDFRNRVDELKVFALRIDEEIFGLKDILENLEAVGSLEIYNKRTKNVEVLMNELEVKLKNDRDALLTGGNPYWSDYLKRIEKLEDSSDDLLRQLEITKSWMRAGSCGMESPHLTEYQKRLNELEELVKRVGSELKSLKTEPMMIGSRVGGESCTAYSKRIRTLWKLVATSKSIINKLIIESKEAFKGTPERCPRVPSTSKANVGALEILAKKFKSGIKELEIAVASGDNAKLIQKIRQLESSVGRLKGEVAAKDEENNSIGLELTGAKIAFGEKVEALEELRVKYEKIVSKLKNRKTKIEAQDSKILRDELSELRRFAENSEADKAKLLEELQKNQLVIEDRENQVLQISKEKSCIQLTLTNEKNEIERNLMIAVEEINRLKKEITELKEVIVSTSNEGRITSEATELELNRLKALLEETNKRLESTTNDCTNLQIKCTEAISEKTKTELELSRMKIQNEALIGHLNSEKVTTSKTLQDYQKLMTDFRQQETDLHILRSELSTLKKCLEDSERENCTLKTEVNDLRQGSCSLRDEALTLKSRLNSLTQKLDEANAGKAETIAHLTKVNEEKGKQSIQLDFLANENEKLRDQLDQVRSDKLNVAGAMNEWRLQCDEARSLLASKTEEARTLSEHLRQNLRDSEALRSREAAVKLKVEESLEANAKLREAMEVLTSDKARLEEQLGGLSNECQALRSHLEALQSDNDALRDDSSVLRRRVDTLTEDARKLTKDVEQHVQDRADLIAEHQETTSRRQRRLDAFATEHATLKAELERLRVENASLKSESDRLTSETEEMRSRHESLAKEMSDLSSEDCALRDEVNALRQVVRKVNEDASKMRSKVARAEDELEALKVELGRARAENDLLRSQHDSRRTESCRLDAENAALKEKLEELRRFHAEDAEYEKLRLQKVTLEGKLMDAQRQIGAFTAATSNLDGLEEKLRCMLKEHAAMKELLRSRNEEVVHLRRAVKPCVRSAKYSEDVRAT